MTPRDMAAIERPAQVRDIPERLLNRLDEMAIRQHRSHHTSSRRRHPRFRYRRRDVKLKLSTAGHGAELVVCSRNISECGLSILHTAPLTIGASCSLMIPKLDATPLAINAMVRSCHMIEGTIHEVGLEFEHAIDVAEFLDEQGRIRVG